MVLIDHTSASVSTHRLHNIFNNEFDQKHGKNEFKNRPKGALRFYHTVDHKLTLIFHSNDPKEMSISIVQKNNDPPWLSRKKNNFILHGIFGTNSKSRNTKNYCKQNIFDRKVIDINNGIKNNYVNLGESSESGRCLKSFSGGNFWMLHLH